MEKYILKKKQSAIEMVVRVKVRDQIWIGVQVAVAEAEAVRIAMLLKDLKGIMNIINRNVVEVSMKEKKKKMKKKIIE